MNNILDSSTFKKMILCASEALNKKVELINELNVFPVPDGDTGTNMAMTLQEAANELRKKEFETVDQVASCVANATLRGARGNSGVILSLLFRGTSKRFKGIVNATVEEFALALTDGVESAYKAVMKPAEGTILTVSKEAAKAAKLAADIKSPMEKAMENAIKCGNRALEQTTEINPVLKKAGVVDAGGKGFMIMLEAMLDAYLGKAVPENEPVKITDSDKPFDKFETKEITYAYDTVFIVKKDRKNMSLSLFRNYLNGAGDSIVIGDGDEEFKVHIHTDNPGEVIAESQKYGTLEICKIENMKMQHEDLVAGRKARSADDLSSRTEEEESSAAAPEKEYGVVAVCAGKGLEDIFTEIGCDGLVTGGQTMNPSTADILKAVNKVPANTVFILPNNKNIIMAAQQCKRLSEKTIVVIPTKSVPDGISAMLSFDPSMKADEIEKAMTEAISNVDTALVTYASRDSEFDGHKIREGEYLAIMNGKLAGNYRDVELAYRELASAIKTANPQNVTLYYGKDISENKAQHAAGIFEKELEDTDISVVCGGQPIYYFIISVEK